MALVAKLIGAEGVDTKKEADTDDEWDEIVFPPCCLYAASCLTIQRGDYLLGENAYVPPNTTMTNLVFYVTSEPKTTAGTWYVDVVASHTLRKKDAPDVATYLFYIATENRFFVTVGLFVFIICSLKRVNIKPEITVLQPNYITIMDARARALLEKKGYKV